MGPLGDDCVHRMGAGACKRRGSRVRPGRCVCVCVCPCVRARVRACVGMVITHQHHLLQHLRRNTTPSPDGRQLSDLAFLWPASQVSRPPALPRVLTTAVAWNVAAVNTRCSVAPCTRQMKVDMHCSGAPPPRTCNRGQFLAWGLCSQSKGTISRMWTQLRARDWAREGPARTGSMHEASY